VIKVGVHRQLDAELALLEAVETRPSGVLSHVWQADRPVVVVGRHGRIAADVFEEACRADDVAIVRRGSGGGTVVLNEGCVNYAVVLSLASRPELIDVAASFRFILETIARALEIDRLSIAGTDLLLNGRKVSGNAQRRGRRAFMQHGTLLYQFDPAIATRYLKEPARQPAHRDGRRHTEFLGNLPLTADVIQSRLTRAWQQLSQSDRR